MIKNNKEMLNIEDVETEYGLKRSTVYKYMRKGLITPYKRAGDRRSYFERRELEELTRFQPKKTTQGNTRRDFNA